MIVGTKDSASLLNIFVDTGFIEDSRPPRRTSRQRDRRSKFESYLDILIALQAGSLRRTRVMYRANLSWTILDRYIEVLQQTGLITESGRELSLTNKGFSFVAAYLLMRNDISHAETGIPFEEQANFS